MSKLPSIPGNMTQRQRFLATMHYQPRDRVPLCDFGFWEETLPEWKKQGLPQWVRNGWGDESSNRFFGMECYAGGVGVDSHLRPWFESKVLEDRGDHEVVQQGDGVRVLRKKYMGSIPVHEGHLLVDRESWIKHYKWRLNPDTPERYPNWDEARKVWSDENYPTPKHVGGGSLYGWIRNWMGMEGVSYLVYDDPALFEEIVVTITDLIVETHRRCLAQGARFDCCGMWEDMCYNSGPLLSPVHFKKYLVPQYKRITAQLRAHGCDIIWLDCDGCIDELMPLWLDAGVNCMFPIEIGTWGADPIKYRKQYGKELLMLGGFDKHILARSQGEIEAEVRRLQPLVDEGGYVPFCDHRVPPDVPLTNYMFYLEKAREIWAHGVHLPEMGQLEPVAAAAS